jgi:UDPglucose 6-dehydrogenase
MPARSHNVSPLRPRAARGAATEGLDIAVIGVGYVGLVTATCMASFGHRVSAFDIDADKIEALQRAHVPIHEAGLAELLAEQVGAARLRFSSDFDAALAQAELVFVAVGTPARADGSSALEAFEAVIGRLCALARLPRLVVLKSTVPVGTTRRVQAALDAAGAGSVAVSNPEFLREGTAVQDFLGPDRILIGCDEDGAAATLMHAYRPLIARGTPVLTMDTRSAELAKCAANAMLAARISFVNEIAALAQATGADIESVCDGIGSDRRIGRQFLQAGLGYGGSCFPKDVAALRHTARALQLRSDMLDATERVNRRQRGWLLKALQQELGGALCGLRVAIWGLAFKPGTDDMREAASLPLVRRLRRAGATLALYDPVAMENARRLLPRDPQVRWCASAADALQQADVLLLVTEWAEFRSFAPRRIGAALRLRLVCDGRNALDPAACAAAGLRLVQVGRPAPAIGGRGGRLDRAAGEGKALESSAIDDVVVHGKALASASLEAVAANGTHGDAAPPGAAVRAVAT